MNILKILVPAFLIFLTNAALALPSLQLGGDGSSAWQYDTSDQTWIASGSNTFTLNAYANCLKGYAGCSKPDGAFAWDDAGKADRYAYLTVASVPDIGSLDAFDISILNDGASLALLTSGWGTPPIEDNNDMQKHGVFDSYYEIYEFRFDGGIGTIHDTQPGTTGSGDGYSESFDITINSLLAGVNAIHFDLFTVSGDGKYTPTLPPQPNSDKLLVKAVAPYSHDAQWNTVPEPATVALMGFSLLLLGLGQRTRKP